MTWQRLHCIECWHDMEHCATCGCHETMPATFIANAQTALESNKQEGDTSGTAVDQARHVDA